MNIVEATTEAERLGKSCIARITSGGYTLIVRPTNNPERMVKAIYRDDIPVATPMNRWSPLKSDLLADDWIVWSQDK